MSLTKGQVLHLYGAKCDVVRNANVISLRYKFDRIADRDAFIVELNDAALAIPPLDRVTADIRVNKHKFGAMKPAWLSHQHFCVEVDIKPISTAVFPIANPYFSTSDLTKISDTFSARGVIPNAGRIDMMKCASAARGRP